MSKFKLLGFKIGGAQNAPQNHKQECESWLSRLPKLAEFKIPNFEVSQIACGVCGKTLEFAREFFQSVGVCEKCFKTYTEIDSILNRKSEQKVIEAKRAQFLERLGGRR